MMNRENLFWRNEVARFVDDLTDSQISSLYLILKSYGCVRTARALKEDTESLLPYVTIGD